MQKNSSMNYSIKTISVFERQAKKLSKKYPSLKSDLSSLIQDLKDNPAKGTPLGNNCYKIRLDIQSKNKGKSGGARVLIHVVVEEKKVYLLSIFDKSKKANITDKELKQLLAYIPG